MTTKLTCPHCGDEEGNVTMSLTDNQHTCECGSCGEEFTPKQAAEMLRERLEAWQAVAEWADAFPVGRKARMARTA